MVCATEQLEVLFECTKFLAHQGSFSVPSRVLDRSHIPIRTAARLAGSSSTPGSSLPGRRYVDRRKNLLELERRSRWTTSIPMVIQLASDPKTTAGSCRTPLEGGSWGHVCASPRMTNQHAVGYHDNKGLRYLPLGRLKPVIMRTDGGKEECGFVGRSLPGGRTQT